MCVKTLPKIIGKQIVEEKWIMNRKLGKKLLMYEGFSPIITLL
jgi:hypothetical protein